jgi:hypothetical protein
MGGAQQFSRLASRRVVSADAEMQVHPAALPLDLIDLAFAVVLAAGLERKQLRIPREPPWRAVSRHAPSAATSTHDLARPQDALLRNDARVVSPDADGFPAGAVRLLAGAGGVPVPGATDALDNADVVGDHGQPGPARRDLLSAVFLAGEGDEPGQKSVE